LIANISLPLRKPKAVIKVTKTYSHVLLADDDHEDCEIFSEVFTAAFPDVKLSISNNGGKLMEYLNKPPEPEADLIFLDLNMPVMTGPECLARIRDSAALKNNIIVVYTTSSSPEDISNMYALGANYFITKPNDFQLMKRLISKAMLLVSETGRSQPDFSDFYIKA
jgi:CheY-like chemotaxis protein